MKPSLTLHENPHVASNELANLSAQLRGWRHVLRDFGGCFDGSGQYWQPDTKGFDPFTTEQQAWQMFYHGLGRRIKASLNDWVVYDGEIVKLVMTKDGIPRVRSMDLIANSVKGVYSRYGSNVVTNPGAETGTTSGGTPLKTSWTGGNSFRHEYGDGAGNPDHPFPDVAFSTTWKSKGAKSYWCDTSPCTFDGYDYGGGIKLTSTTAAKPAVRYALSFFIHITANTAGKEIRWGVNDDTNEQASGKVTCQAAGGGTNVDLRFVTDFISLDAVSGNLEVLIYGSHNISAIFYVDDVMLFEAGTQKATSIYTGSASIVQYGTRHVEFTFGGMDDEEADDLIQLRLAEYQWPRTEFPDDVSGGGQDGLTIETMGYIDQALWTMVSEGGAAASGTWVSALVGLCELISAGRVATNARLAYVEALDGERVYDALQKIVERGGTSNVRYSAGIYQNLKFDYYLSDTAPRYARRNGVWCHVGGPPVEPCLMRPGLARDDDMPDEPFVGRDPRWMYLEEIEYDRDSDSVRVRRAGEARNRLGIKPVARDAAAAATVVGTRSFIR